jgi:hypothetical protein
MEKLSSDRNLVRDRPHPFVVSRSSFDRRDARRKLLESDVVVGCCRRPPMSATKGFRGGGSRLRYARFARRLQDARTLPCRTGILDMGHRPRRSRGVPTSRKST